MCLPDASTRILVIFITWWVKSCEADLNQEKGCNMAHQHPSIDSLTYCSSDSGFNEEVTSISSLPTEQVTTTFYLPTNQVNPTSYIPTEQVTFNSSLPTDYSLPRWNEIDYEDICSPLSRTNDILNPPSLSRAVSASIRGHMEYITEENAELKQLCENIEQCFESNSSGNLCSDRARFKSEFDRIKSACKKTRFDFKRMIRGYLPSETQEHYLNHSTVAENVRLLKKTQQLIDILDEEIKEQGLGFVKKDPNSVNWPEFSGEDLPLINDFLKTFEQLANQVGIPNSERGHMLMKNTKGNAKYFISLCQSSINPTYCELRSILKTHFGTTEKQMEIIEGKQMQCGQLPDIHHSNKDPEQLHRIARDHLILMEATERLNHSKKPGETPLTSRHIKHLENLLPRALREDLTIKGYNSFNNQGKFQELKKAFEQKEYFLIYLITQQNHRLSGLTFNPKIPPPLQR